MNEQPAAQPFDKLRIISAFLLAPLIVVGAIIVLLIVWGLITKEEYGLAIGTFQWNIFIVGSILVVAYAHELLIALPIFLVLKKRINATLPICIFFGFAIGFLPMQIVYIFNSMGFEFRPLLICGFIGAAIGYVFWRIGIKPVDSK